MKQLLIAGIIIGFILAIGYFFDIPKEKSITNFEECAAKYAVMESYPRQCMIPGGASFVEDIGNEIEKIDIIRINTPRPNQIIESPFQITGEARGNWFFEGDFPIRLLNENREEIAIAIAKAESDWMVEDFVAFTATLEFSSDSNKRGTLVLEKDNPSGMPENDDALFVPVKFK
ncbi:MAG: Gmad2 immunoglobulin-like domain-containing protein [Patescibacteria group bacterium]|nr:Gmad2 immunoglobulin-like domain-containing protein [Patescibacteria group bacterium]